MTIIFYFQAINLTFKCAFNGLFVINVFIYLTLSAQKCTKAEFWRWLWCKIKSILSTCLFPRYAATHARPTFCNVCREPLGALGTAHALACELCKFKAHKLCASRAPPSCKWSTLASLGPHVVEDAEGVSLIIPLKKERNETFFTVTELNLKNVNQKTS